MAEDDDSLYREIEHTADLTIEIVADEPAELFRRAGLAVFRIMVEGQGVEAREERLESVAAEGYEELLHDWLGRLIFRFLTEGFVAAEVRVEHLTAKGIDARLLGERLNLERHRFRTEIKAVTWHDLVVTRASEGWRARVTLDV